MTSVPEILGAERYRALVAKPLMTLEEITVTAVLPPLPMPVTTASGQLTHAPVLLIDLQLSNGVRGVSYVFCPRPDLMQSMQAAVRALFASVKGQPCDPAAIFALFDRQLLLFGGTGLVTMARGGIDMALWDALGKAHGAPLYQLWNGQNAAIRAYESSGLGLSGPDAVMAEAIRFVANGFKHMKVRLGYADLDEDIAVLHAVRHAVGPDIGLMVDYNQSLSFEDAKTRCQELDDLGLLWIEEPLNAADLEGVAALRAGLKTPVQIGENLFSQFEVKRALALGSGDYMMPDAMKIGGATGWLMAADAAAKASVPVSSHLFPEISRHLLASAPNAHFLEYANWTDALLVEPVRVTDGFVSLPDAPGIGMEWNAAAVEEYRV